MNRRIRAAAAAVLAIAAAGAGALLHARWKERRNEVETRIREGEEFLARDEAKGEKGDRDLLNRALGRFGEALKVDPGSARAHRGRGRAEFRLERWTNADEAYERALLDPSAPASWHREAGHVAFRRYLGSGNRDDLVLAARHYEDALARDPSDREALKYAGSLMEAGGERARRDEYWKKLLEVAPEWEGSAEIRGFLERGKEPAPR